MKWNESSFKNREKKMEIRKTHTHTNTLIYYIYTPYHQSESYFLGPFDLYLLSCVCVKHAIVLMENNVNVK